MNYVARIVNGHQERSIRVVDSVDDKGFQINRILMDKPLNKKEELLVKMVNSLHKNVDDFMDENAPDGLTHENFNVINDAPIKFAADMVLRVSLHIKEDNEIKIRHFETARKIFNEYMNEAIGMLYDA